MHKPFPRAGARRKNLRQARSIPLVLFDLRGNYINMKPFHLLLLPATALLFSACAPDYGPRHVVYGPTGGGYYEGPGYYGGEGYYRHEYYGNDHRYENNRVDRNVTDVNVNRTNVNERTVNVNRTNVNRTDVNRGNVRRANVQAAGPGKAVKKGHRKNEQQH